MVHFNLGTIYNWIMAAEDYAFVVHTLTYELAHSYYIIMDTQ
jgi:hypothetical protein